MQRLVSMLSGAKGRKELFTSSNALVPKGNESNDPKERKLDLLINDENLTRAAKLANIPLAKDQVESVTKKLRSVASQMGWDLLLNSKGTCQNYYGKEDQLLTSTRRRVAEWRDDVEAPFDDAVSIREGFPKACCDGDLLDVTDSHLPISRIKQIIAQELKDQQRDAQ